MNKKHRFEDKDGLIHACEGGYAGVEDRSPYLAWTLCKKDVPANKSFKTTVPFVGCAKCKDALNE